MKYSEFSQHWLRGLVLIVAMLGLTSCSVLDPADSSEKTNAAPETKITSAPSAGSTTSYYVTIAWKGEDADGVIKGYNLVVDGASRFVTRTDSTFRFTAANKDEPHSISVAAVDDKDEADPTPATLSFNTRSVAPNTALAIEGNPTSGATFGRGGVFTILAIDDPDNGPEYAYRFKIDDAGQWSDWLTNPVIEFSTTSSFGLLPEGAHKFIAQVRDAAMAVDETPIEFAMVVSNTVKPVANISGTFNSQAFFDDNSAFSVASGNKVNFSWTVSFNYAGAKSTGSRFRFDNGTWSEYSTTVSTFEVANAAPGNHALEVQYRDLGGVESAVAKFNLDIVAKTFDQGILVVDDGEGTLAGRPAATGDLNADRFYNEVLTALGAKYTLWDVKAQGIPTPGRGIGRYSTVIWQSDEAAFLELPRQTKLASEYLSQGGKLWVVGWRGIQQIAGATPVVNFQPGAASPASFNFIWNFLKIASTKQTNGTAFDFSGAVGLVGQPNLNLVVAKNPIPNRAGLSPIDAFTVRSDVAGVQTIYTFASPNGTSSFQGEVVGMKYLGNDFKVAVFGFPLYHMVTAEVIEAARVILKDFGEIQ